MTSVDLRPPDPAVAAGAREAATPATRRAVPAPRRPAMPATVDRVAPGRAAPAPAAPVRHSAPTDNEKLWYFGRQQRWVLVLQLVATGCVLASLVDFAGNLAWSWLFYAPVALMAGWAVVSTTNGLRRRRLDHADHLRLVEAYDASPSVDVFLPSCGEPLPVLRNTYEHVATLRWRGGLQVHVLDDSGRPEVSALAAEHGFAYHVRPDRGHLKKAGNLRYGYEHTEGDLIAIFDADFCPRADFLEELVPYFGEESVGIVQSPQFFDADDRQNWLERAAGATQEFFYRWVQPARDTARGAICVGTCAMYRRAALQAAGGFAQIGHSEDVHTGVGLLKAGFSTRYVPIVVAKGICPDDVMAFVNQQYRWCAGSMSLLRDRAFHAAPLSLRQRLCFWSGFFYYLTTATVVLTGTLPTLAMAVFAPDQVHATNYVLLGASLLLWSSLTPVITHDRGRRLELARVQIVYSFAHALAIYHTFFRETADWVPTGSVRRSGGLGGKVVRLMRVWLAGTQGALWAALLWRAPVYGWDDYWAMGLLLTMSTITILPLLAPGMRLQRTGSVGAGLVSGLRARLAGAA